MPETMECRQCESTYTVHYNHHKPWETNVLLCPECGNDLDLYVDGPRRYLIRQRGRPKG
ncbi:hypothetical protein GB928_015250 [Shinella curvata]|uniref:Small CPxCG-related zinc finger protein n=1 Tax=Shinella curvata TaxID=1817964 RepID=A0ABT8XFK8_9HYPH|nr:hypothetical protein [Shinella curvata]MCJ8053216.1 hypothetical protein [Shinella curvata]MDO6122547.1 hypothetical protein [Shinella curvata]